MDRLPPASRAPPIEHENGHPGCWAAWEGAISCLLAISTARIREEGALGDHGSSLSQGQCRTGHHPAVIGVPGYLAPYLSDAP